MSESSISLEKSESGNKTVVTLNEHRLDSLKAPALKTEILKLISDGANNVLLNLENVVTIDSSGIGSLTFAKRQLETSEGSLSLCSLQDKVSTVIKIAKLDEVFDIYDNLEDGIK